MRKLIIVVLVLVLGLLIPHVASAYSVPGGKPQYTMPQKPRYILPQTQNDQCLGQDPQEQNERCCGQDPIVINGLSTVADNKLQDALTNYSDLDASTYYSNQGIKTFNSLRNRYELCFEIADPVNVGSTISIVPIQNETKGLAVYGLNLRASAALPAGSPVIEVNFPNAPVALIDMSMSDVVDGLSVVGTKATITNVTITGAGGVSGNCIDFFLASNSIIQGSVISGCGYGFQIDNSSNVLIGADKAEDFYVAGQSNLKDANHITDNGIGIKIIAGSQIQHGFNRINQNGDLYSPRDAIVITDGQNGYNSGNPVKVMPYECEGGTCYVHCSDSDDDGEIDVRKLKLNRSSGTLQLYYIDDSNQADDFQLSCDVNSEGYCDVSNIESKCADQPKDECTIFDNTCSRPAEITAIYTDESSSMLLEPIGLYGNVEIIFAESGGVDVPTAPASDEQSAGEVDITAGSQLSAEGGATEIAAVGAKGGCMGGGASLLPNDISSTYAPHLGAWWIIFSIALLASMRMVKVRARQRSSGGRNRRRRK